jgi:hypothetical protein
MKKVWKVIVELYDLLLTKRQDDRFIVPIVKNMNKLIKNPCAVVTLYLTGMLFLTASGCSREEQRYGIYENHDISACGLNDPLLEIEWLKEYCDQIKEKKDISPVYLSLFKVIDQDEHIFKIAVPSSVDYAPNKYYSSQFYLNCSCDTLFYWWGDLVHANPSRYNEFMEDKEFVTELFHFIQQ